MFRRVGLRGEIDKLRKRLVELEQQMSRQSAFETPVDTEIAEDAAEVLRVLKDRFSSVWCSPLSAGQLAIHVTDDVFRGLSWMKRHHLIDPFLENVSDRAFSRIIEVHARTPEEMD